MKYSDWIRTRHEIEIIPTEKVWGLFYRKKVPIKMVQMPVSVWMQLKDAIFDIVFAPQILSIYLDLNTWHIEQMQAGRVIAIFNHVKAQTEKCNKIWANTQEVLLDISDGINRMHWQGKELIKIIYDLAKGDILRSDEVEKVSFAKFINWMSVEFSYVREDQEKYIKDKQKMKKQ